MERSMTGLYDGVVRPIEDLRKQYRTTASNDHLIISMPGASFVALKERVPDDKRPDMGKFCGQVVRFECPNGLSTQNTCTIRNGSAEMQRYAWTVAMFTDIKDAGLFDDVDPNAIVDNIYTVHRPVLGLSYEERVERMYEEFMKAWQTFPTSGSLVVGRARRDAVMRLITDNINAKESAREQFLLDDLLRCTIDVKLDAAKVYEMNPHLHEFMRNYGMPWLRSHDYDPKTIDITNNRIMNKKGQPMKLTKALAKCVPDPVDPYALACVQGMAFARNPPNRDSMLALLSTALQGVITIGLTANITDFITASHNGGFSSCHAPGKEHFSGNIGLARTPNVFMGHVGPHYAKSGRMWIYYDHRIQQIAQLKSYGIFPSQFRKPLREYMEHRILPNARWVHRANGGVVLRNTTGACHDGYIDASGIDAAYLYENGYQTEYQIQFDSPLCVSCGCDNTNNRVHRRRANCDPCQENVAHCASCGDCIEDRPQQIHPLNNRRYCMTCYNDYFTICEHCDQVTHRDNLYYIHLERGGERPVCERCANDHYVYCTSCEDYYEPQMLRDVIIGTDGYHGRDYGQWCPSCRTDDSVICPRCATPTGIGAYDHERSMCVCCREETHHVCQCCNQWVPIEQMVEQTGYCQICTDKRFGTCIACNGYVRRITPTMNETCHCLAVPRTVRSNRSAAEEISSDALAELLRL